MRIGPIRGSIGIISEAKKSAMSIEALMPAMRAPAASAAVGGAR